MLRTTPISYVQLPHAVHDRYLIVDDDVWLLGTSVKDMGRSLCTIIKVGFCPETVMSMIKKDQGTDLLIPKTSKRTKTSKTPSDVCDSCRVCVLSVMALSVRTSSYVKGTIFGT